MLVSKITRESIDLLKEFHKEDMKKEDWLLIIALKKVCFSTGGGYQMLGVWGDSLTSWGRAGAQEFGIV